MANIAVLISGRGSNMKSIVEACRRGDLPAETVLVVSNRADAAGLTWAQENGVPTAVLSHRDHASREDHDRAVIHRLRSAGTDWVCLAGYMRLLSPVFIDAFPDRILNIHPSLLPAFPGLDAQRQAWEYGVAVSGCTVHLVDVDLDHGPIVAQAAVAVEDDDTVDSLSARILRQEHRTYPRALRRLLTEPWTLRGRRVVFEAIDRTHSR